MMGLVSNLREIQSRRRIAELLSYPSIPTYYVDAIGGSDGEGGRTSASAWQTIAKVNGETFLPGDRILFKRGETWREQLTLSSSGVVGAPITFGAYGNGADPIISGADILETWTSYAGNTWQKTGVTTEPLQVFMDDTRLTEGANRDNLNDHEWVWDTNVLYVRDETGDPDGSGAVIEAGRRDMCIWINAKNNITIRDIHATKNNGMWKGCIHDYDGSGAIDRVGVAIRDCEASWSAHDGISFDIDHTDGVMTGLAIYNNSANNNGGANEGYGIRIEGTGTGSYVNTNIYSNVTNTNGEEGIRFDHATNINVYLNASEGDGQNGAGGLLVGANNSNANVYRNWIKNPIYEGIWCNGVGNTGLKIYYNVIFGGGAEQSGIQINQDADGAVIYNNLIRDFKRGIDIGLAAQATNLIIKNNIITDLQGGAGNIEAENSSTFTADNNIYDDSESFFVDTVEISWAQWQALGHDTNGFYENPDLVDPGNEDFNLQSISPCRDAGVDVGLTEDYAGVAVPQETNPAIGAYEYVI